MTLTDSRITATATSLPEKLKQEIRKTIYYYNKITSQKNQVVFLEIGGNLYLGRVTLNKEGKVLEFTKLTVERMRNVLSRAALWRTHSRLPRDRGKWTVNNGGKCPRDVAIFALDEMQREDLPDLPLYSIIPHESLEGSDTG